MLLSKLLGERFKEKPADAFLDSHIFLLRGGYIQQVSNGIFTLLTPAKKITQKIEKIIREEMDKIDGQEVLFPVVMPAELWKESGRYDSVGSELLRFKDRVGRDMLLGMTHEEAAVHLARNQAKTYLKYPFMIYQIQTKFRDEPRARGGLIRVREFTMKDAYSFHTSQEDLESYYERALNSYKKIFSRVGLGNVIAVKSDSGMMGGHAAHEFMYLSDGGEDSIVLCDNCGYQSNMEVAIAKIAKEAEAESEIEEIYTPNVKDIESLSEFLGVKKSKFMKASLFIRKDNNKTVIVFIRGDLQVNESKLKKELQTEIFPLTSNDTTDLCLGFVGAYNLDAGDAQVVYDDSLKDETNLICGANKTDYHLKGISVSRDLKINNFVDVAKVNDNESCVICGKPLKIQKGIEVGNIFQLGTKYTKSMNMTYVDESGKQQTPIMGCYGIGVGRLLSCILENHHDNYGPIWPKEVAPWQIHICILNNSISEIHDLGFDIYNKLMPKYDVIMDDRNVAAGVQFADADLIGAPIRIIVSKKNVQNAMVEISTRDKTVSKLVDINSAVDVVNELLN
jgi:prolyl-tRNA synthetase